MEWAIGDQMVSILGFTINLASGLCYVIFLLIAVGIARWIYLDAEARGKDGLPWAIITLIAAFIPLLFLVVLILWILVRPPLRSRRRRRRR